jgi:hypothetical protein
MGQQNNIYCSLSSAGCLGTSVCCMHGLADERIVPIMHPCRTSMPFVLGLSCSRPVTACTMLLSSAVRLGQLHFVL